MSVRSHLEDVDYTSKWFLLIF